MCLSILLGVLNARSVGNKGPLLANIITSHSLYFLCFYETHVCRFDTDSFLWSITPDDFITDDFIFLQRPCPSGIGGGVYFFIRSSYRPH